MPTQHVCVEISTVCCVKMSRLLWERLFRWRFFAAPLPKHAWLIRVIPNWGCDTGQQCVPLPHPSRSSQLYYAPLLRLGNRNNQRTNIVALLLVVRHMTSIAQGEGARLKAAAVHLFVAGFERVHGDHFGSVEIDCEIDLAGSLFGLQAGCCC